MKPSLLHLLLLLLTIPVLAQREHWEGGILSYSRAPLADESGVSIHVMPLSLFNEPSRIRFGAQYKHKRFGYLLDLEYGADKLRITFDNASDPDYRFFGFRPEFRYDLNLKKGGVYAGLELPITLKYSSHSGNLIDRNQNGFYVENALERRTRLSAIVKLGLQVVAFRHLLIDVYLGGGGAYRHYRFTNLENAGPLQEQTMEWGCCELKRHGGTIKAELAFGFRLGYWLPLQ